MNCFRLITASIAFLSMIAVPARAAEGGGAPGAQRRWALDFRVRLDQPGTQQPIEILLTGDWVSTVIAVRPGESDAALEIVDVRLRGQGLGVTTPGAASQVQARLGRPFWATWRDDGALLAVHFYKGVDPNDRNLLQMIAAATQLVRPNSVRPVWTVTERDGAGSYLARYDRSEPRLVVKRKLRYISTDGVEGAPASGLDVGVDQSEIRFSLDASGGILSLDGIDRMRIGQEFGDSGALTATTEIHLSRYRGGQAPILIGSLARARSDVESSAIVTHKPDPEKELALRDANLLEGHTTASLLEAAFTTSGDKLLSDRLAALFRRHSEAIAAAINQIRSKGPAKPITQALASAGAPPAIDALSRMAHDRTLANPVRVDALAALIPMRHPILEAMQVPSDLLDDADFRVAAAAGLAYGALARAGRDGHPAEANRIDSVLAAHYRKAADIRSACDRLGALGNSASPAVVPAIQEALRDSRPTVRAAAARALRLATGDEIDRRLAETITKDSDPAARAAAIFASGFRHPLGRAIGEAVLRAAKSDTEEYVRGDAIGLLRQNPGAATGIAETLAWIAEHDAKPGVRRVAQDAVAALAAHDLAPGDGQTVFR